MPGSNTGFYLACTGELRRIEGGAGGFYHGRMSAAALGTIYDAVASRSCERPDLSAVCEALYGAALEPSRWPEALYQAGRFVGGEEPSLVIVTFAEGLPPQVGWVLAGLPGSSERYYRMDRGEGRICAANSPDASDPEVSLSRLIASLSMAREFALRHGAIRGSSRVLQLRGDFCGVLHVLQRDAPLAPGYHARLDEAAGHIARAVEVYAKLRQAKRYSAIAEGALDSIDVASFVMTLDRRLVRSNRSADALAAREDGLLYDGALLRCVVSRTNEVLDNVLQSLRQLTDHEPVSALLIPRRSGSRPYVAFISRLTTVEEYEPMAVMVVRDLEEGRRPVDSVLGSLFGMTPSEVRVAVGIVQGDTPQEIAVRLGLSVETVRSHLKRVFYKSSTRNQADLVRLVLGQCVSS